MKKNNKVKLANLEHQKLNRVDRNLFWVTLIFMSLIPITVHEYSTNFISPILTEPFATSIKVEFSSFYKSILIYAATFLMLLGVFLKLNRITYHINQSKFNLFIVGTISGLLLSSIFSSYKMISVLGDFKRFEGSLAFLCYNAIFFVVINMKWTMAREKMILFAVTPFLLLNVILGLCNFYGMNLLHTDWFTSLIGIPNKNLLSPSSIIPTTLSNPNYSSGAGGFLGALFFSLMIFHKDMKMKIASLICSVASMIIVFTSLSTSGFLTIIGTLLPIFLVTLYKAKQLDWKTNVIMICSFAIASGVTFHIMAKHDSKLWDETFGVFINDNPYAPQNTETYRGELFSLSDFQIINKVHAEDHNFELPDIPKEGVGPLTGRVYIWEQTIKLWMERPIFGHGLDTLPYKINHNDPLRPTQLGGYYTYITKPHSMYLGWLYGGGIVLFTAYISLFGYILLRFGKVVLKGELNPITYALGFGFIGYLIQGLVNDTQNGSSTIFWILLGLLVVNLENENQAIQRRA